MTKRSFDDYTVDELIAASEELDERVDHLPERLGRITGRAGDREHGIEVTVNLEGRITDLELTDAALRLGPARLAEEVFRLTRRASGAALADSTNLLREVAGDEAGDSLDLAGAPSAAEQPVATVTPPPDEDYSQVKTWALPG
jgi:hypothetical protein